MSWLTNTLSSTLGKKLLVALTGLFLVTFLIAHLAGNLQLLADDGGKSFNIYAKFMTTNPLVKTISYILYTSIILHVVWTVMLIIKNKAARPVGYHKIDGSSSSWSSRNMGLLGTIILIFLIIHLRHFWYEMHWGGIPMATYDGQEYKDLFAVVAKSFSQLWYTSLYVVAMLGLMFHLVHGFQSAFQTLGLNHVKYNPAIRFVGVVIAVVIPAAFAAIPILMYLDNI